MTPRDKRNTELIDEMVKNKKLVRGLKVDNVPITVNDLIEFCRKQEISLDTPILLCDPDGDYYPLEYYHNAYELDMFGTDISLGMLAIYPWAD